MLFQENTQRQCTTEGLRRCRFPARPFCRCSFCCCHDRPSRSAIRTARKRKSKVFFSHPSTIWLIVINSMYLLNIKLYLVNPTPAIIKLNPSNKWCASDVIDEQYSVAIKYCRFTNNILYYSPKINAFGGLYISRKFNQRFYYTYVYIFPIYIVIIYKTFVHNSISVQ